MASSGGGRQRVRSSRRRSGARHNRPNKLTETRSPYARTTTDPSETQHIRVLPEAEVKRGQTFASVVASAATGSSARGNNQENSSNRAPPSPFFNPPVPAQAIPANNKPTFADKLKTQVPVEIPTDRKDPRTFVKPKTGEKRQPQPQQVMETGENAKPTVMARGTGPPTMFSKVAAYPQQVPVQALDIAAPRPRITIPPIAVPDSWENLSQASSPKILSPISDRRMNQPRLQQPVPTQHLPTMQRSDTPAELRAPEPQDLLPNTVSQNVGLQDRYQPSHNSDYEDEKDDEEDNGEDEDERGSNSSRLSVSLSASQASELLFGGDSALEKLAKKNISVYKGSDDGMVETDNGKPTVNLDGDHQQSLDPATRPNGKGEGDKYSETRSFWDEMNRWRDYSNRMEEGRQQAANPGQHPAEHRHPMQHHLIDHRQIHPHPMDHPYHPGPYDSAYDPEAERLYRLRHRNDIYTRLENLELSSRFPNHPNPTFSEHDRKQFFDYRNNPDHFGLTTEGHGGYGHRWGVDSVKAAGHGGFFPHLLSFQDGTPQPPPPAQMGPPYERFEYVPPGIGGRLGDPLHPDYIANVQKYQRRQVFQEQPESPRFMSAPPPPPPPPPGFGYIHYGQAFEFPPAGPTEPQPMPINRFATQMSNQGFEKPIPVKTFAQQLGEPLKPNYIPEPEDSSGEESEIQIGEEEMDRLMQQDVPGKLVFKQRHSQMARTHDTPLSIPTRQPKGPNIRTATPEESRKAWAIRRGGRGGVGRKL